MIISKIGHKQSWWFESNVYEWQNAVSDNFGCAKFLKMLNICKLVIKVVKMVNFDQKLIFKFLICFFVSVLHQISISFWLIKDFWLNFEIGEWLEHSMVGTSSKRIYYDLISCLLMPNAILFQQVWKNPGQWRKRSVRFWSVLCS